MDWKLGSISKVHTLHLTGTRVFHNIWPNPAGELSFLTVGYFILRSTADFYLLTTFHKCVACALLN